MCRFVIQVNCMLAGTLYRDYFLSQVISVYLRVEGGRRERINCFFFEKDTSFLNPTFLML